MRFKHKKEDPAEASVKLAPLSTIFTAVWLAALLVLVPSLLSAYSMPEVEPLAPTSREPTQSEVWSPWDPETIALQSIASVAVLGVDVGVMSLGVYIAAHPDTSGGGFGVATLAVLTPFIVSVPIAEIGDYMGGDSNYAGTFLGTGVGIGIGSGIVYLSRSNLAATQSTAELGGLLLLAYAPAVLTCSVTGYHLQASIRYADHPKKDFNNVILAEKEQEIRSPIFDENRAFNEYDKKLITKPKGRSLVIPVLDLDF